MVIGELFQPDERTEVSLRFGTSWYKAWWCAAWHALTRFGHCWVTLYDGDERLLATACTCGRVFWIDFAGLERQLAVEEAAQAARGTRHAEEAGEAKPADP